MMFRDTISSASSRVYKMLLRSSNKCCQRNQTLKQNSMYRLQKFISVKCQKASSNYDSEKQKMLQLRQNTAKNQVY